MTDSLMSCVLSNRRLISFIIGVGTLCVAGIAIAAIVSGGPAGSTTGTSAQVTMQQLTINKPAGVSASDVLVAGIAINGVSSIVITPPDGWVQIASTNNDDNLRLVSYRKVVSASEPSTYTWTINGQTTASGGITRYSGVDASNPIDQVMGNSGFGLLATTSAITTSNANEQVINLFAVDAGKSSSANAYFATSTGVGMVENYDVSSVPNGPSTAGDDALQASAGTVASMSSAISGNKAKNWASQVIALRPAPTAIAYDNSVASSLVNASSQTTSFTTSGSNICLVVQVNSVNNDVSASYDGVTMTQIAHLDGLPGTGQSTVFILTGAPAGGHDIVVTASSTEGLWTAAVSYNGCGSVQPDNVGTSAMSGSSFTQSLTSSVDNAWAVLMMQSNFTGGAAVGTGSTLRASNNNGQFVVDTNGPIHPAGTATLNLSDSIAHDWLGVMLTLAPAL